VSGERGERRERRGESGEREEESREESGDRGGILHTQHRYPFAITPYRLLLHMYYYYTFKD